jgi:hypothetical protein
MNEIEELKEVYKKVDESRKTFVNNTELIDAVL